jgi:NAD(P)-dependent dehydrogenase (short-subunit alcohol dehydrogenase family)
MFMNGGESPFSLQGQLALITGGGTGIGLGIARCFVQAGARVALVGRREIELNNAVSELGAAARAYRCDITSTESLDPLLRSVGEDCGPVSILVNNAGIHLKKPATAISEDEFTAVMRTHVGGAFQLTRRVAPPMLERRRGSILFIASMASLMGIPMVAAYTAAKSAIVGLVRSLTAEFAPCGVRVNAIAPGWIETEMLGRALAGDDARKHKVISRTPMASFGKVDDIGWAAVYLCSPAARFVTGVVLPVDGGASVGF